MAAQAAIDELPRLDISQLAEDNRECGLCTDDYDMDVRVPIQLTCSHVYCLPCLIVWAVNREKNSCPYCRGSLYEIQEFTDDEEDEDEESDYNEGSDYDEDGEESIISFDYDYDYNYAARDAWLNDIQSMRPIYVAPGRVVENDPLPTPAELEAHSEYFSSVSPSGYSLRLYYDSLLEPDSQQMPSANDINEIGQWVTSLSSQERVRMCQAFDYHELRGSRAYLRNPRSHGRFSWSNRVYTFCVFLEQYGNPDGGELDARVYEWYHDTYLNDHLLSDSEDEA